MEGYHNNEEATAETLDVQGWLHTGDIGELDERGFLRITDRKKDLFKTSGGKYVAPSAIETMFKGMCPYASHMLVHGADRNFVSALVTLDPEAIEGWAAEQGLAGRTYSEVVSSPQCRDMVQRYIDELNLGLNRWEQIKRFTILERDLTVEEGELTPSMKLRRKHVDEKYRGQLDAPVHERPDRQRRLSLQARARMPLCPAHAGPCRIPASASSVRPGRLGPCTRTRRPASGPSRPRTPASTGGSSPGW